MQNLPVLRLSCSTLNHVASLVSGAHWLLSHGVRWSTSSLNFADNSDRLLNELKLNFFSAVWDQRLKQPVLLTLWIYLRVIFLWSITMNRAMCAMDNPPSCLMLSSNASTAHAKCPMCVTRSKIVGGTHERKYFYLTVKAMNEWTERIDRMYDTSRPYRP